VHYKVSTAMAQLDAQRAPLLARQAALSKSSAATQASINQLLAVVPPNVPAINAAVQKRSAIDNENTQISQELFTLSPTKLTIPTIVGPASIPQKPSSPNKLLNLAVGLFVGFALGLGQAFLREHLDDRLRTELDLAGSAQAPVLAVIPGASFLGTLRRKKGELATRDRPAGAQAEAFRTLRTGLIVTKMHDGVKTLLLTSPNQDLSRTAANLAVVLADADKRVILVSANLRKPRIHAYFDLENEAGLSSVLSGEANLLDVFQKQDTQNLRVLCSGPVPANPGEMLQSDKMREVLAELSNVADFIILDSSPVLSAADATTLSTLVDGVILVGDAQRTTRSEAAQASRQLNQVAAPLLGAVLINYDPRKARARASAHTYYGYPDQHRYRVGPMPGFSTNGQGSTGEEHAITRSGQESAP
jgi:receptor protein-tyrosine kinase